MAFGMAIAGRHGMARAGKWGMRLGMKEGWVVVFSGGSAYFQSTLAAGDQIHVDWGDGTSNTYASGGVREHIYADNEEYTVRIYGTALKVCFQADTTARRPLLKQVLPCNPVSLLRNNDVSYCFYDCSALTSLPSGLFGNTPALTDARFCFWYCEGLTSLPSTLFVNMPALTNVRECFERCTGLTSLPSGIFGNAPALTTMDYCFNQCHRVTGSIPALWTNPNITSYSQCYAHTGHQLTPPPNWTHSVDNICAAACAGWTAGLWTGSSYCDC